VNSKPSEVSSHDQHALKLEPPYLLRFAVAGKDLRRALHRIAERGIEADAADLPAMIALPRGALIGVPATHAVSGASISPRCRAIGWKSLSSWSSGLRFSMHQVPISRPMVLRRVIPRLRKERKFAAAAAATAATPEA